MISDPATTRTANLPPSLKHQKLVYYQHMIPLQHIPKIMFPYLLFRLSSFFMCELKLGSACLEFQMISKTQHIYL